jgi:low affinity Fe/Cu permease
VAASIQTRASHRRFIPMWHFFALPVLIINVFIAAARLVRLPTFPNAWSVVVAIALVIGIFLSRSMPLRAQDRVIRLEERLRMEKILPADLRARIDELTPEQLIGLRFASDDELPALTRRALSGELRNRGDIKGAIANWRPDMLRV